MIPNRPTERGRELGRNLARLCDNAEREKRKRFPNMRERCKTCAFRSGTIPNGCEETLMDALKCVMEIRDFMCHEKPAGHEPQEFCAGYLTMLSHDQKRVEAPWPFSTDPEDRPEVGDESYIEELKAEGF